MSLKDQLKQDMIEAMRSGDKDSLGTIRLINSAIKQFEIDNRLSIDDNKVLEILNKLKKQRLDSIDQYTKANRSDLADVEAKEIQVIEKYLPELLSEPEVKDIVDEIVAEVKPSGMAEMGKIMSLSKEKLAGRADMSLVSSIVKNSLQNL